MNQPTCEVHVLGPVPYKEAWELQGKLAAEIGRGVCPPTLLLLEHSHTYTIGRRGNPENLLWGEAELARRRVSVHWVDRGGDVTYHGPGQIMGYPILALTPPSPLAERGSGGEVRLLRVNYVDYARKLEKTLIEVLARFGIVSGQMKGFTGVWVKPDVASRCPRCPPVARKRPSKIAAIGVKVDAKDVTRHGFALNVRTDMAYWEGIIGCGLEGYPVVSLADLLWELPEMKVVIDEVVLAFRKVFGYKMAETSLPEFV